MAWNFSGYEDFWCSVNGFENPLSLDVRVDPASNKGANLLSIYTGTLLIGRLQGFGGIQFEGPSSSAWSRGQLSVTIPTPGKVWTFIPLEGIPEGKSSATFFHGGISATVS